jgi:NAD(P)-dependent dehydrogenase (short-subunit alcohol dehydrogenase family)
VAALVTGANRGLGFAFVDALRAAGVTPVVATYRDEVRSEALLSLAGESNDVVAVELDVTSDESVAFAARRIRAVTPSLRVVVNNAGIGLREESILDLPLDEFRLQIETHALGPLRVVRAVQSLLSEGSVVANISSVVAGLHRLGANYAGYAHAKALQNAVTCSLAATLRSRGIVVLAIDPGWVATRMGGSNAPVSPQESATAIVGQVLSASLESSGTFRNYLGRPLDW